MGKLDVKRFRQDLKAASAGRDAGAAGRPAVTGAMAIVRENLDLFDRLRADDPAVTWTDIAVSLGQQGVLQRDGQPITAKRLCALISTIRKQRVAKEQAATKRRERRDLASRRPSAPERSASPERRLALAPDLVGAGHTETGRTNVATEEDRRHAALDRAKAILKKD